MLKNIKPFFKMFRFSPLIADATLELPIWVTIQMVSKDIAATFAL